MYATRVTLKQMNPALVTCRCGQMIQIRRIEEKEDKGTINFAVENVICKPVFISTDVLQWISVRTRFQKIREF